MLNIWQNLKYNADYLTPPHRYMYAAGNIAAFNADVVHLAEVCRTLLHFTGLF